MERERQTREQEEKIKAEKAKKMKETFGETTSQWEKDKNEMQNIAFTEEKKTGAVKDTDEKASGKPPAGEETTSKDVQDKGSPDSDSKAKSEASSGSSGSSEKTEEKSAEKAGDPPAKAVPEAKEKKEENA